MKGFEIMRSVFKNLERANVSPNPEIQRVSQWVYRWMLESGFSSYKKHRLVIENFMLNNKDLSPILGVSERTAKNVRLDISREAYQHIGSDFFDLLFRDTEDSRKKVQERLDFLASKQGSEMIRPDLLVEVRRKAQSLPLLGSIHLHDCAEELKFLKTQTKFARDNALSGLNVQKLDFLLNILDGQEGSFSDRMKLTQFLREG